MEPLRIVFMGTPQAVTPLLDVTAEVSAAQGGEVVAVYSAPDKPSGRGRRLTPSPVKRRAEELGIPVLTPSRLTLEEEQDRFRELRPGLVVLAAYGLLLPAPFLFEPPHGALNIHPSLLPRHRGAAPVVATILAGDQVTGTSLMVMDEGLDTGPVLAQRSIALEGRERTPALTEQLLALGADMLQDALPRYIEGSLTATPQPEEGVTRVPRMSKADGRIDWSESAEVIERRIRAYDPWPGTATSVGGLRLAITQAEVGPQTTSLEPGEVRQLAGAVVVGAGRGSLRLLRVKIEGRPEADIAEFVRGRPWFTTARLPS